MLPVGWKCARSNPEMWVFSNDSKVETVHRLQVSTSRIGYVGQEGLNVTRGSGTEFGKLFAPSWSILRPALEGLKKAQHLRNQGLELEAHQLADQTWEPYRNLYIEEMRESYKKNKDSWKRLLGMHKVALLCYCMNSETCHRTVLANILVKCGARYVGEI